jgi:hypothetical protein
MHSVAASGGKKTEDGTLTSVLEADVRSKPAAVADPLETQILTPAATKEDSYVYIAMKWRGYL